MLIYLDKKDKMIVLGIKLVILFEHLKNILLDIVDILVAFMRRIS